jgi:hypothetical protein
MTPLKFSALLHSFYALSPFLSFSQPNARLDDYTTQRHHLIHITRSTNMHRYRLVPPILLVLSLINFLLAAPVVLQELAPSVGEPPANPALAANSPPSPRTGTSTIQDAASASSPEINKLPPSDEDYPSSGESYLSDHDGSIPSENYHASDEGGPGPSKSYSDSFSKTDIIGVGSYGGTPESSKSYPGWSRPELELEPEPQPVAGSNPSASGLQAPTGSPAAEPKSGSQKSFLSKLVSKSKSFLSKLASKSKNFLGKLAGKLKFWRRTSESVSARQGPGPGRGAMNAAQRGFNL